MVVACAAFVLHLPTARSLKDKRSSLSRLKARVRDKFNVSVAEVDDLDLWGSATLGVVVVTTDSAHAHRVLERVARLIEDIRLDVELLDYRIEML